MVFAVPELWLLGGDYDLSIGAPDEPPTRTVRFSIAHQPSVEGVVDLRGSWRALARAEGVR